MKREISVIIVLALLVTVLSACGGSKISKEDAELMAGKWDLVVFDYFGVKMLSDDEEDQMSFEFKNSGVTTFTFGGDTADYKWEKDDDLITIWESDNGVSRGHTAVLDGDSFTLYWNYDGTPVNMVYARAGSEAANPELYISEDDVTSTMLKNADENNILELLEKMTPEAREEFGLTEVYDTLTGAQEADE